jgi:uncharacterized RDD family membrane protein YckC
VAGRGAALGLADHPLRADTGLAWRGDTQVMDSFERQRPAAGRLVPRREILAQAVTDRAVDLVVSAVDMNAVLDRVDLNAVLDRIDLDRLLERVDLNSVVARLDIDALVEQTDLGAIIASSSSGVASDVLDAVRSQTVGLDEFIARWTGRLRRRPYTGPPALPGGAGGQGQVLTERAGDALPSGPPVIIREGLQRTCSGFASRFAAFAVDVGVSLGVFMLALAAISFAARVLTGKDITWNRGDIWVVVAYAVWAFIYFAYSWATSGRTAGMALFGVRVVRDDGTAAGGRRAVLRTLALPLSFLFLGLGFAGIVLGNRRRALHDVIAGTAVIYSWDARAARLRFLSRD